MTEAPACHCHPSPQTKRMENLSGMAHYCIYCLKLVRQEGADLPAAPVAVDPDMPTQQLRLHMGELTASEVRVARAAIRWANSQRQLPAQEWKPIDTAPKDGAPVIVGRKNASSQAYWEQSTILPEGGWWEICGCGPGVNEFKDPTHWMPLRKPPAAIKE